MCRCECKDLKGCTHCPCGSDNLSAAGGETAQQEHVRLNPDCRFCKEEQDDQ